MCALHGYTILPTPQTGICLGKQAKEARYVVLGTQSVAATLRSGACPASRLCSAERRGVASVADNCQRHAQAAKPSPF